MLLGVGAVVSALVYAVFGSVDWTATAPLALGMFAGSILGPGLARRVPGSILRVVVAAFGLLLAAYLLVDPA
jgi:uncharacterized protein